MKTKEESLTALKPIEHTPMGEKLVALFSSEALERVPEEDERGIAVQIVLTGGYACAGILTVEHTGLLRVVQQGFAGDPNVKSRPPQPVLASHYFTSHNIVTLIVVKLAKPAVGDVARSPIIMGS